jgi:elongation factor P hydroxylase
MMTRELVACDAMHDAHDLMVIFHDCFARDYNTRLVKGDDEPIYLPANEACAYHSIVFAHGFFSSALHECAHWLIAGDERRTQVFIKYTFAMLGTIFW